MKLPGKSAIVTGAASGIGKEIAILFAREGAKVAIADLNKDAADKTAGDITSSGGQAIGVAMDVTDEDAVNDGVEAVVKASGGVDILVSRRPCFLRHSRPTPSPASHLSSVTAGSWNSCRVAAPNSIGRVAGASRAARSAVRREIGEQGPDARPALGF